MGLRWRIRALHELASEFRYTKALRQIDELHDLVEEMYRAEPGRRKPDPKRIEALLSLLEYGEAIKAARNRG